MKSIGRSYSFFISALLSLLSFVLAIAIALTLFAHAKEQSYLSENKTIALSLSQDIIEEQKRAVARMDEKQIEERLKMPIERSHRQEWNGEDREFRSKVSFSRKGAVVSIDVSIAAAGMDGKERTIVSLNTEKYIGW